MNSDTGEIYTTRQAIAEALLRGERIEPIGPGIAEEDKKSFPSGSFSSARYLPNRKERRAIERMNRKALVNTTR